MDSRRETLPTLQVQDPHDQLVLAVERDRDELARAVDDLRIVATDNLTLGHRVSEDCWKWLLGAAVAGMWLGTRSA